MENEKFYELAQMCMECIDAWKKENWHRPLDIRPDDYVNYCRQHGGPAIQALYDEVFPDEERQQGELEKLNLLLHGRNRGQYKKTILTNVLNDEEVEVHATTDHPCSSYGQPVWVDDDGTAYCQVGMETPFYAIRTED